MLLSGETPLLAQTAGGRGGLGTAEGDPGAGGQFNQPGGNATISPGGLGGAGGGGGGPTLAGAGQSGGNGAGGGDQGGAGGVNGYDASTGVFRPTVNYTGGNGFDGNAPSMPSTSTAGAGGGGAGGYGAILPGTGTFGTTATISGGYGGGGGASGYAGGGAGGDGGVGLYLPGGSFTAGYGAYIAGGGGGIGGASGHVAPPGGSSNFGTTGNGGNGGAGIFLSGAASLTVAAGAAVYGGTGAQPGSPNVGRMAVGVSGSGGAGIMATAGSFVSNSGAVYGGLGGYTASGASPNANPFATGGGGAGILLLTGSTLLNNAGGTVQGGEGGQNSNGISAAAGIGGAGVIGAAATVVNAGSIQGGLGGYTTTGDPAGSGGAAIQGSNLTVINSGSLAGGLSSDGTTTANAVTFTGGVNRLQIEAGSTITGSVVAFSAADVLAFGGVATQTFDGSRIGPAGQYRGFGSIEKVDGGTTTFTGTSTYSAPTSVLSGTLAAANLGAFSQSSAFTVANGATLNLAGFNQSIGSIAGAGNVTLGAANLQTGNDSTSTTFSGVLSGAGGGLSKVGVGTLTLSGTNTYTGGTRIADGTLQLGSGGTMGSIQGNVTNNGTLAFNRSDALTFGGTISGTGAVSQVGGGTTTLSGTNSYQGGTAINAGTLSVGADANLGAASGTLTFAGGTLATTASFTTTRAATLNASGGTFAPATGTTLIESGVIAGAGGLIQAGSGTTTLTGANSYRGGTSLNAGTVQVSADINLGDAVSALLFNGGTLATTASFATSRSTTLGTGGGTFAPAAGTTLTQAGITGGFGMLTVAGGGTLALTGANTYAGATAINPGATLQLGAGGTGGSIDATSAVTNNGGLIANRSDTLTLAAPISGTGTFTQSGPGTTVLTARNTYTGATTINAGTLQIDGVLTASNVTVNNGGTLGGSGKIGDPIINAGGTLAPGSATAIGNLSITGPLTFADGSFYRVKITPSANDRTTVTGTTTIQGGTVQVLAGSGTYTPDLRYTLVSATGGVSGRFSLLQTTSNLAFLSPSLGYDANDVYLTFSQAVIGGTPVAFTKVAVTPNQVATAGALQSLFVTNPLYVAILNQSIPGARAAFDALSGEVQASAITAEVQTAFLVRETILDHLRFGEGNGLSFGRGGSGMTGAIGQRFAPGTTLPAAYSADLPGPVAILPVPVRPAPTPYAVWGQAFGSFGNTSSNGNAAQLNRQIGGFILGAETGAGVLAGPLTDAAVGVAAGYSFTALDVPARQATGQIESGFGAVYGRAALGPAQIRLGAAYAGNALDTRQSVLFPGFSQPVSGRTGSDTVQGFGEVGYRIGFAQGYVEPFAGGGALSIRRDGFIETGGLAALTVYGCSYDVQTATVGVQGQVVLAELFGGFGPMVGRGLIGYRRAFGDVVPAALLSFAGGGTTFLTSGIPIAQDAVVASAGLDWQVAHGTTIGINYTGQVGRLAQDHAVKGSLQYHW